MNYEKILLLQKANTQLCNLIPKKKVEKAVIKKTQTLTDENSFTFQDIHEYNYDTLAKNKVYKVKAKLISISNNNATAIYDNENFYNIFMTKYKKHIDEFKNSYEHVKIIKPPINKTEFHFSPNNLTINVEKTENLIGQSCNFYLKIIAYNFNKDNEQIIGIKLLVTKLII